MGKKNLKNILFSLCCVSKIIIFSERKSKIKIKHIHLKNEQASEKGIFVSFPAPNFHSNLHKKIK